MCMGFPPGPPSTRALRNFARPSTCFVRCRVARKFKTIVRKSSGALTNDCILGFVSCLLACLGCWPCQIPLASLGREGLLISYMGALDVHVSVLFLDRAGGIGRSASGIVAYSFSK